MKQEFRTHPLMIISMMKRFLFVLVLPVVKGIVQYIIFRRVTGFLTLEIMGFAAIAAAAVLRCRAYRIVCGSKTVTVYTGVLFKKCSVIPVSKLSSVQTVQNPLDAVFGAVTYRVNTEAGKKGKTDFEFKLSLKDSKKVSELLYGKSEYTAVKFSAVKVAVMAATSSSAVTGMIIGVPVINKTGKLLGLALDSILLNEINTVSEKIKFYFPPIVSAVTLIFLLSYAVSFVYSFLKYVNFKLFLEKEKLEVRSGFFVRSRTAFKKASVNDVIIDQTPLMRAFRRYAMKVSVGGYGNSKSETAVMVPSERRGNIKRQFQAYFPFLVPDGKLLHAKRDRNTRSRYLFFPRIYFAVLTAVSVALGIIFPKFARLVLFLFLVAAAVILYYSYLGIFEYKFGKIRMGNNIYAQGIKGFNTAEFYCPKENIGEIKIIRTVPDRKHGTCNVVLNVRSESADSITVHHLNTNEVLKAISEVYNIDV